MRPDRPDRWLDITIMTLKIAFQVLWWLLRLCVRMVLHTSAALVGFVIGLKLHR